MDRVIKTYEKIVRLRPFGFWPGFIVGLAYFSYVFQWLWSLYPLDTLGISNRFYSFLLIFFVFTLTIAGTSFFWGLFSFLITRLNKKSKTLSIPLITAGAFVISEYARAWGVGFLWFGSGALFGPHWTLGNPAYLLSFLPWVIRTSSVWGIYGIDFLIIFSLSAIVLCIKAERRNKKILLGELLAVFFTIFAVNSIPADKQQADPLTFSVVQTKRPTKIDDSPEEFLDNFSQQNILLKTAAKKSHIVLFPETANFSQTLSEFFNSSMVQKYFGNLSSKNTLIVDSDQILEPDGLKSKIILIDSKNGIAGYYDKKLLTPGGEYLPYILKIPFYIFERLQNKNLEIPEFTPGSGSNIIAYQNNNIKILACSDIISPSVSRGGSFDLMLDLNSLGLFRGNNRIASEMVTAARFRAAESGKYLIMASNYGLSYVINQQGNIVGSTGSSGYQILTGTVVPNKKQTWYNKLGDLPILLLSLAIFGLGLINLKYAKQD
jgi:apolipoprotein N-acyltransferase